MDQDLQQLEQALEKLKVKPLPEDLLSKLSVAMNGAGFGASGLEDKIVPFESSKKVERPWWSRQMLGSAAAVAVLGGFFAFQNFKAPQQAPAMAAAGVNGATAVGERQIQSVQPYANASKNIISTSDQGVVYSKDNKPHRCMRVEYLQEVEMQNQRGEKVKVEQPAFEYLLVPLVTE